MDAFIGEIRLMAINFVPRGWFPCDGRVLQVQAYQALWAVIGNTYGGTPPNTFALPNLIGRVTVGAGDDPSDTFDPAFGNSGGSNAVTLTSATMPSHTHNMVGAAVAQSLRVATPQGNYLSAAAFVPTSGTLENGKAFTATSITPVHLNANTLSPYLGTGGPHENRQPYLALQYCICNEGEFPVRP
ncbi:phage tail protein [Azospirillum sp. sgz301742]